MQKKGIWVGLLSGLLWAVTSMLYGHLNVAYPITQTFGVVLWLLFLVELTSFFTTTFSLCSLHKRAFFKQIRHRGIFLAVCSGLLGGPVGMFCYLNAIHFIGVGYSATISASYPIFASLFAWLFLREKLTHQGGIGIIITLVASMLLSQQVFDTFSWQGLVFAFLCALSWGAEIILSAYVMRKNPVGHTYLFRQFGSMAGYGALILYEHIKLDELYPFFHHLQFNIFLLGIVLCTMGSYLLYYFAINILKPIKAMMLNITYGIWAVVLNAIFYAGEINLQQLFLMLIMLLGTGLVLKQKQQE